MENDLKQRILEMKDFFGWKWSDIAEITGLGKETVRLYVHYPEHAEKYLPALEAFDLYSNNGTVKPKIHNGFKYGVKKKGLHNLEDCIMTMYSARLCNFKATIQIELKARNVMTALDSARTMAKEIQSNYQTLSNVIIVEADED